MPDGSLAALHTREETINVRFSDPVHFTVQQSRHGALISAGDDLSGSLRGTALALSAPHLLPQDRSIHALLQLNTAKSVADARMALADYRAPMQNVFLADHFGNISFIAAGSIPKRGQNTGLGPFNGWETAHDWHGWYPQSANPSLTNPPKGYIANGNNRPWAKPSPYLAHHWKEPYRAQRIIAFLEHPENHTMATFQMMQHDVCSAMMADLIPRVLSYIATDSLSPRGQQWRDTLQQWDGCMTVQSKTPTFAVHWLQFVQDSLLRPEERSVVHTLQPMFIKAALAQHACHAQDCQKIIRAAYHKVLENTPLPTWGEVHQARFNHLPTGMLPIIGAYTATTHPTGGGDFTINRGTFGRLPESGMAWHRHGAGLRTVMNARDLNKSVFSISGGQSGNFLSAFAENLHGKWRNAEGISFTNSIEHRIIAQP
jgi:penicillin amidase